MIIFAIELCFAMKDTIINFLSNILAVVLGIVITFTIQGKIDKAQDKSNIRSTLELVRTELATNIEDIGIMRAYLKQEKESADYFLANMKSLDECPVDSINYHSGVIFADVSFTLCNDALELMKMSSMFQKIGNNNLSMKIIRAYDTCSSIEYNLNKHIATRDTRFENSINEKTVRQYASTGNISIKDFLKTDIGSYAIRWMTTQPSPEQLTDVTDVEDAITAIDSYLKGKRLIPKKL